MNNTKDKDEVIRKIENKSERLDLYKNNWIIGNLKINNRTQMIAPYQIKDILNLFDDQDYKVKKGKKYTGNMKDLKRFLRLLEEICYFMDC